MGSLIGFAFTLYILSLIFSMLCALFRFLADVRKWHDKEEKVHITPSQFEADLNEPVEEEEKKEVNEDAGERREHNTSAFSIPWGES
ncbi:MAG: hypothetical protein NC408_09330 [Candidatus Gastranaerophilales bacterium]|nr:hypothetical protein [Candidatus Gastranaerophilales bacterium]MCM1073886.1 hypothetical protein [Bacteroides sp.]